MKKCYFGDCRDVMYKLILEDVKVQTCVTSPPYWGLRDYGVAGQIGLEASPEEFIDKMVDVFSLVRELLTPDGTLWLNIGDTYAGAPGGNQGKNGQRSSRTHTARIDIKKQGGNLKPKDLVGIPWMLALALRADGWYLRQDIIWYKPNPMPESVRDRCTKSHEHIFLLSKEPRYYYDSDAIREKRESDENANGFRGGSYTNHETHQNNEGGKRKKKGNQKIPSNWDTDKGRHGAYHRLGRDGILKPDYDERKMEKCEGTLTRPPMTMVDREYQKDGRNKHDVWTVSTQPFAGAHFATFPPKLIEPCILAGSRPGDIVLDPFFGSGTTGQVAEQLGRKWIGIELNTEYEDLQRNRTKQSAMEI